MRTVPARSPPGRRRPVRHRWWRRRQRRLRYGGARGVRGPGRRRPLARPPAGTPTSVIWTDDQRQEAIKTISDGFAEENGISVDVQVVTDLQSNFITANNAGNGPDVVTGAHDWIGNLVQNGAIDPLQLTPDQLGAYSDVAVKGTTYDEQLYGLPYGVESLVLYRNTDLAPEAPATLDDAFAAGQAVVAAGKAETPFIMPVGELGDAYHMQPLYTSAGGYVFGRNAAGDYDPTDLGVGNPASIEAAKKISALGSAGAKVLSPSISGDNYISLFAAGKSPFLLSGPWARADIEKAGLNYEIQPVPGFAGAGPAKPFAGVQAFFVASKGKNKAFAQEFVANTMNTPEAMQTIFDMANLPPALTALQESAGATDPDLKAYLDAANAGEPMPAIPQMQSVFEPLGKAYAAIVGGADPVSDDAGDRHQHLRHDRRIAPPSSRPGRAPPTTRPAPPHLSRCGTQETPWSRRSLPVPIRTSPNPAASRPEPDLRPAAEGRAARARWSGWRSRCSRRCCRRAAGASSSPCC
jgi:arabinogalactan oligomer/maltooligosaccharide transport system substrate-binding protein